MVAYFFKNGTLAIVDRPGSLFGAEVVKVSGKREARAICKARNITPWNF